jgi:8-oxo-dGTP pyrophosphatase MutT (NUDIX family)
MTESDLQKLANKFPTQPNILGKEEFFNSAVLIPLVKFNGEYNFLFEKRAENIRQGGEICFPGGEIEPNDKDIKETILRETFEETGIRQDKIKLLGRLDTLIGPRGITVDSYVGIVEIKSLHDCNVDKSEVEKIFFIPVSFFENTEPENFTVVTESKLTFYNSGNEEENLLLPNKTNDKSYFKNKRKVFVYKAEGEIIWGITARLVYQVIKMLRS